MRGRSAERHGLDGQDLVQQSIVSHHYLLFPPDSNLPLARRKELTRAARGWLVKEQPINLQIGEM